VHFNVLVTSRDLQTFRLGIVSKFKRLVSVSSRLLRPTSLSRLGLGRLTSWSRPLTSRAHPCQHLTTQFLQAGCPSCHPTNSVKALNACLHVICLWNSNHHWFYRANIRMATLKHTLWSGEHCHQYMTSTHQNPLQDPETLLILISAARQMASSLAQ